MTEQLFDLKTFTAQLLRFYYVTHHYWLYTLVRRFLGGEASAEENSWGPGGGGDKGSKVSVVLSEMRVPAEIKGELCTSVVSTVFEMDYTNRKWKVVKHTNVIKGTSHSSPSSANRAK